jgi:uncharacterized protein
MRIAYLYFMADKPELIRAVAPSHAAYWHERALPGYLGGPFADRSGGLILFQAADQVQAEQLVSGDPFVDQGLLADCWVKEWTPNSRRIPEAPAIRRGPGGVPMLQVMGGAPGQDREPGDPQQGSRHRGRTALRHPDRPSRKHLVVIMRREGRRSNPRRAPACAPRPAASGFTAKRPSHGGARRPRPARSSMRR